MVYSEKITLMSEGKFHAFNITDQVKQIVTSSGIKEGQALVFYQHTSGSVIIVEHEAGMLVDLEELLDRVTPVDFDYKHHLRGYDQNGAAHLRTGLLGVSVTIPIIKGELCLGMYQEVLVIDFDRVENERSVIIQVNGE